MNGNKKKTESHDCWVRRSFIFVEGGIGLGIGIGTGIRVSEVSDIQQKKKIVRSVRGWEWGVESTVWG